MNKTNEVETFNYNPETATATLFPYTDQLKYHVSLNGLVDFSVENPETISDVFLYFSGHKKVIILEDVFNEDMVVFNAFLMAVRVKLNLLEDPINHPSHYNSGKIEVIDFIEDQKLNFARGSVVKYVARAGKKDPDKEIMDLQKAQWYINREIERLEKELKEKEVEKKQWLRI